MALVNRSLMLDITPGAIPKIVNVSEYDENRQFTVNLIDEGGVFEIPTGTTATVEGTLNGTVGFTTSATISNNQITFALTESMTAYAGRAWCKIKLTLNDEPIQTCAFVLAVDRAGVEADTVIGASGFEQQIVDAVQDWLDEHPPAVGGMSEAFKQALLDCFENVAWINDQGQTYYDALYAALYPPKTLVSISAVFTQGSAVIYDTDSLDTLKQYLTVTATYDDSSTGVVTNYTLSGTLTAGTSTITVIYNGKTTTFNVAVTSFLPSEYQLVEWIGSTGEGQYIDTGITNTDGMTTVTDAQYTNADAYDFNYQLIGIQTEYSGLYVAVLKGDSWGFGIAGTAKFNTTKAKVTQRFQISNTWNALTPTATFDNETISFTRSSVASNTLPLRLFSKNTTNVRSAIALIYNVKTYDTNNSLISDLYPCYRKSDGVIGVYDIVRNTFLSNAGTGTFTKGDDV